MTIRPATVALLLALSGCGGFYTGLNPQHEIGKEPDALAAPPTSVVQGIAK